VDEDWLSNGNHDKDANNVPNPGQHGDEPGHTTVTGQLDIKYGGDGPGTITDYTLGGAEAPWCRPRTTTAPPATSRPTTAAPFICISIRPSQGIRS